MKKHYLNTWNSNFRNSKKLGLYDSIKENYELEDYLTSIRHFEQRRYFTKMRISNHKLAIETGRYIKLRTEERLCVFCNQNQVETEEHMLLNSPFYFNLREELLSKVPGFIDTRNLQAKTLLKAKYQTSYYVSRFILKAFELRDSKI